MSGCRIGRSYPAARYHGTHVPAVKAAAIRRSAGGYHGTLSNWGPTRMSWPEEGRNRETAVDRANDLAANHPHAASLVDSITVNAVGPGLWPQSKPNFKRLGLSEGWATEFAEQAEWEFELFNREADAREVTDFYGKQFQNLWSMLVNGEFVNLPLMINDPSRRYSLALQDIDPVRLRTPMALRGAPDVRDGIRLGANGQPVGYFLADPEDGRIYTSLDMRHYRELPPRRGHRPVVLHRFHAKFPEQVRGVTILAPAMKFFRDVSDYLDYELVGAIVASSFPVWIEKNNPYDANGLPGVESVPNATGEPTCYRNVNPGQLFYGNAGEKPHILKSDRPGNSFPAFIETILRAVGAAAGMPYEVISKDFSKTNYSSARAALQEAWRVFELYQDWLVNGFCQVVWEMFLEEAFLRGRLPIPKSAPDFYAARAEYCAASWVGPERTNVDPVKEMVADIMGLNANITTLADVAAKRNKDWEQQMKQRGRERQTARDNKLNPDPPSAAKAKDPATVTE